MILGIPICEHPLVHCLCNALSQVRRETAGSIREPLTRDGEIPRGDYPAWLRQACAAARILLKVREWNPIGGARRKTLGRDRGHNKNRFAGVNRLLLGDDDHRTTFGNITCERRAVIQPENVALEDSGVCGHAAGVYLIARRDQNRDLPVRRRVFASASFTSAA